MRRKKKVVPPPSAAALPALGANIQDLRKKKQWTLKALSEASGVSTAMLSQIEAEKVNPTVATVWKIAQALGADLNALVKGGEERIHKFDINRSEDITSINVPSPGVEVKVLSTPAMAEDLEFYLLTLNGRSELVSKAHFRGTEEYLTVLKGSVRVEAGGHEAGLKSGDVIHYDADVDHVIRNSTSRVATAHLVVRYGLTEASRAGS